MPPNSLKLPLGLALLAAVLAAVAAPPAVDAARRCSFRWSFLPDAPTGLLFLGVPLPDTVFTGPGSVNTSASVGPGHFGSGRPRPIYGQKVAVERVSRWSLPQLDGDVHTVVLVPWDYGPSCDPLPWSRSARWLTSADSGVFSGRLRPRDQWVEGLPTLDLYVPKFHPYPAAYDRDRRGLPTAPRVDAREYLLAVEDDRAFATPSDTLFARTAAEHWWSRGARDGLFPYSALHIRAIEAIRVARQAGIVTPVAGLYAVRLRWPGTREREFFMRVTTTVTASQLDSDVAAAGATFRIPETIAYSLYAVVGPTADSVARRCAERHWPAYHDISPRYGMGDAAATVPVAIRRYIVESAMSPSEAKEWFRRHLEVSEARRRPLRLRNDSLRAAGRPIELLPLDDDSQKLEFRRLRRGRAEIRGAWTDPVLGKIEFRAERLDAGRLPCA